MLTKNKVLEMLKNLPEEFSIDDLLDKLLLIQKVENGLKESKEGNVVSDDKLETELGKWFD